VAMNEIQLAREFHEARRDERMVDLPSGVIEDLDHALRVQLSVADTFVGAGERIGGWKLGLTSGTSLDAMGVGIRPFGYVLDRWIIKSGTTFPSTSLPYVVEPELCLILGADLAGEVGPGAARAAVINVAAAFEVVRHRVPVGDLYALVGDGLGNQGVVIGDTIPAEDFEMASASLDLYRDGRHMGRATAGHDLRIDDPFVSLARLSTMLHKHGRKLESGQSVITGSFLHFPVNESGFWRGHFSRVGDVSVRFNVR
jgi:2-oxo-hept-3-ene-1,7-dioate hydratase